MRAVSALAASSLLLSACGGPTTYSSGDVPRSEDPGELLSFFADANLVAGEGTTGRAFTYLRQRHWDEPGWTALMERLDLATTGEEILTQDRFSRGEQAAALAARVMTYLAEREDADGLSEVFGDDSTEHLAHIVSTYAVALPASVYSTSGSRPQLFELTSDTFRGPVERVPLVTRDTVSGALSLTVSSDAGLAELRSGLNAFRALSAAALGDALAAGVDNPLAAVATTISEDLYVETLVLEQLRADTSRSPGERESLMRAWVRGGEGVFERVQDLEGATDLGRPDGVTTTGLPVRALGSATQGERAAADAPAAGDDQLDAVGLARLGGLQEWYLLALVVERGNAWRKPATLDVVRPGGALISYDDLSSGSEEDQDLFIDQLTDPQAVRGFGPVESVYRQLATTYTDLVAPVEDD